MSGFDRRDANMKVLAETDDVQNQTKDAIDRIKKQTAETEELGGATLEELRKQGRQMDDINSELESVNNKLDQSGALQERFNLWAGNWFGGKKKEANAEAQAEIAAAQRQEHSKVREVFQHEKFEAFSRTWKNQGFVLCNTPTVAAPEIFDPTSQAADSNWKIDYSLTGIDPEGWTYAYDFATLNKIGSGDPAPKWNSYVRRRKWKFEDRKASNLGDGVEAIRARNAERQTQAKGGAGSSQAREIAYATRRPKGAPVESGRTTKFGGGKDKDDDLDEDSRRGLAKVKQNDAEIDEGIDEIAKGLDKLDQIASHMNAEVRVQNAKLDKMDNTMQKVAEKQTYVNAQARQLLK